MRRHVAFTAAFVLAAAAAWAGEIADRAAEAEKRLSEGDAGGAVVALDAATEAFWSAMPLLVRKAELADSIAGYGIYTRRQPAPFAPGSSLLIYVEPLGYGYGKDALGNVEMGFDIDLRLSPEGGDDIVVTDLAEVTLASLTRNREMFFKLTLNLDREVLSAGRYKAEFTLRDRHSTKRASFPIQFEIGG